MRVQHRQVVDLPGQRRLTEHRRQVRLDLAHDRPRLAKAGITVDSDINSQPTTTSKARDQPGVSSLVRPCAARIWLSHSVPSRCPFGNWSSRSQRHVVIIASTRIRHARSTS